MISVIVPFYNEEEIVQKMHKRLSEVLGKMNRPFEIIFIDDGSTDKTFELMKGLKPVKIVKFRRNFGQTAAIDAGIHHAQGDIIVTIDGDLQNEPNDIPKLIAKLEDGYDVVAGWRQNRLDSFSRRLLSRLANWLTWKVTGLYLHDHACALKAMRKEIFEDVHLYGEMHVFLAAYLYSKGAKVVEIPTAHYDRVTGLSKSHFTRAVKANFDLLTLRFISNLSRPMVFFGGLGAGLVLLGIASGFLTLLSGFFGWSVNQTFVLLFSSLSGFTGILLFMMGFLAELMLRTYYETKFTRPYVVEKIYESK